MKQTTIKISGKDYPLYKTMRAQVDIERSSVKQKDLKDGVIESILYVLYLMVKGVCIREHIEFDYDFNAFVDAVEPDALDKLAELNDTGDAKEESPDKKKE